MSTSGNGVPAACRGVGVAITESVTTITRGLVDSAGPLIPSVPTTNNPTTLGAGTLAPDATVSIGDWHQNLPWVDHPRVFELLNTGLLRASPLLPVVTVPCGHIIWGVIAPPLGEGLLPPYPS